MGGWFNSGINQFVFDISLPVDSLEKAAILADQDSVFSLETHQQVNTEAKSPIPGKKDKPSIPTTDGKGKPIPTDSQLPDDRPVESIFREPGATGDLAAAAEAGFRRLQNLRHQGSETDGAGTAAPVPEPASPLVDNLTDSGRRAHREIRRLLSFEGGLGRREGPVEAARGAGFRKARSASSLVAPNLLARKADASGDGHLVFVMSDDRWSLPMPDNLRKPDGSVSFLSRSPFLGGARSP